MICDVCGHQAKRLPAEQDPEQFEEWVCLWCYAVTMTDKSLRIVSAPVYSPMHRRWERAHSEDFSTRIAHAYGYFSRTLCGIGGGDISASPYPWIPDWDSACQDCKDAAQVIDDRWPVKNRSQSVRILSQTDHDIPPF